MSDFLFSRRALLVGSRSASALLLAGCDRVNENAPARRLLGSLDDSTLTAQRFLQGKNALAREFRASDISPDFRANGTTMPGGDAYADAMANGFSDWGLIIDGLVDRPLTMSLGQLRKMPARTQITRHDCVEGWSAIGSWTGVPLGFLLKAAGLKAHARYAVFHCADNLDGEPEKGDIQSPGQYYESIDLIDAFHPQTILADAMNGAALPVAHGAPLRLRVERQLGYKQAKYVQRIQITDSLAAFGSGKGGY